MNGPIDGRDIALGSVGAAALLAPTTAAGATAPRFFELPLVTVPGTGGAYLTAPDVIAAAMAAMMLARFIAWAAKGCGE